MSHKLISISTGGGFNAWSLGEGVFAKGYVLITNGEDQIPTSPETDLLTIGVYGPDEGEPLCLLQLQGREGLNQWYLDNVGYRPDAEVDPSSAERSAALAIEELLSLVAEMIYRQQTNDIS